MTTNELFEAVETALENFAIATARGDHATNWHALRITPDGEIYTSEEASPCYSESEYYNKVPHNLTIHSQRGNCWTPSVGENPGWLVNEDGTLDLDNWVGDRPEADNVCYDWREKLQSWIDAGNFSALEAHTTTNAARDAGQKKTLVIIFNRFDADFETRYMEITEATDEMTSEEEELPAKPSEAIYDEVLETGEGSYNHWNAHRASKLYRHPLLKK